ncbi:hypothetical protein HCH_05513 [Hahella chejuensis KCTC 2396]|uniref:Uncharacterized protein n=1 Tax=Hahella chejuensis (strain KCTC 2396) TaxID=349521 RepID=Q2SAZ9_HAHCH|nr:hypothetical protein HCH_05513 [Hahella chejuensis KCTC 2396]
MLTTLSQGFLGSERGDAEAGLTVKTHLQTFLLSINKKRLTS